MSWKTNLYKLWAHVKGLKWWLALAIAATVLVSVLNLLTFDYIRQLIDYMLAADASLFFSVSKTLIILVLAALTIEYTLRYSAGRFAEESTTRIRNNLVGKIDRLPMEYLDNQHSGDVLSRLTNDVNLVREFLAFPLTRIISIPLMMVFALGYMIWVSWSLTLLSVLLIPVMGWLSGKISSAMGRHSRDLQNQLGKVNEAARDSLSGLLVTKSFNLEQRQYARFSAKVKDTVKSSLELAKRRSILGGMGSIFNISPFIICLLYGGILIGQGQISAGQLLAFVNLLNYVANPMQQIPRLMGQIHITMAAAGRIHELTDLDSERSGGTEFEPRGDMVLELNQAVFAYDDKVIFNDLSFKIHRGEQVALVGPSGGGKSTVLKLITGFYPVQGGSINFFGHPMHQWDLRAMRSQIAMVTQDTYLYPGTIAENIGYGKPGAEEKEIIEAAKIANAHEFIISLPGGYQSSVGELGSLLSGGQKQRIAIARAILKDAELLLLDEPTSALDTESELQVQKALDSFMTGKTSIIVAHRLSTIINADRILVIADGGVVEEGRHDQLLARKGEYYKLYQTQLAQSSMQSQAV